MRKRSPTQHGRHRGLFSVAIGVLGLGALGAAVPGCAKELDTTRAPEARGTIGEELFGVFCDRVGGQALHEDLTGASFVHVCHKKADGTYDDQVNQDALPAPAEGAVNTKGEVVALSDQEAHRAYAVSRVEAMARRRADLIEAFDAVFPDRMLPVKDINNPDPAGSCDAPPGDADRPTERSLGRELADMLGRFGPLYKDNTVPQSTQSIARVMEAFQQNPEAQAALARFSTRKGYRPTSTALGMARPMLAYPRMRELSAETLRVLSIDSNPYELEPKRTSSGRRIPVPGAAYQHATHMLEAAHEELRTTKADPPLGPLTIARDDNVGRDVLSRPRGSLEVMEKILFTSDPAFGGGPARYIVRRDPRGYAAVRLVDGKVPQPFVDANNDLLPDVDAKSGGFVGATNVPSPFLSVDAVDAQKAARDPFGRALREGASEPLFYDYLDTSHTFLAQLIADSRSFVDPDPTHNRETLMNMVGGAYVIMGSRTGGKSQKSYAPDPRAAEQWSLSHVEAPPKDIATRPLVLTYDGIDPKASPLLDFVHALGQIIGDRTTDDTLQFSTAMMTEQKAYTARLAGSILDLRTIADKYPAAGFKNQKSTFWDEIIEVVAEIAKTPGMLEDLIAAIADDDSLGMRQAFAAHMKFRDVISYDRDNLNGPVINTTTKKPQEPRTLVDRDKPDSGSNRSIFQRFVQMVADTDGVTACNKAGAKVHADVSSLGVPLEHVVMPLDALVGGSFKECEVFKIENLASFYLDSIVGKGTLYFRPRLLREGATVFGQTFGQATVGVIEESSGITGFWDPPDAKVFRPKPEWLNRLVNFDLEKDSPKEGGRNYKTNRFLKDLQGENIGTSVCPERVINDPDPRAADASPDGKIRGLRSCKDGDWMYQRNADSSMVLEQLGFFKAMAPTLKVFVDKRREDLLTRVMTALHKSWQSEKDNDCTDDPKDGHHCWKAGLSSYEPFLAEMFAGDILQVLHDSLPVLKAVKVKHCTVLDANRRCTSSQEVDGVTTLAEAVRALFLPERARAVGLVDRQGRRTAARNDGGTSPQVTPGYLLANSLRSMDLAYGAWAEAHPEDKDRQIKWRLARSQLVDQLFGVKGRGASATFENPGITRITPVLMETLRAQLLARCPSTFADKTERCAWARDEIPKKVSDTVTGPLFASGMDMMDAVRADERARRELEAMMRYTMDEASKNDALANLLASSQDMLQLMKNDEDMVPMLHVAAEALAGPLRDAQGNVVRGSVLDAQAALLSRIAGRAYDQDGQEICAKELDPNQVLNVALQNLVTPLPGGNDPKTGAPRKTPVEVIIDVIADVNRVAPEKTDRLRDEDYRKIATEVAEFLTHKERGLEQFYEIVRSGVE